jgi:hypothetical protein
MSSISQPVPVRFSISICLLLLILLPVGGFSLSRNEQLPILINALCANLVFTQPVVLDIRCGEWTSDLEIAMRQYLLSRQVDVRENGFGMAYQDTADSLQTDNADSFNEAGLLLTRLGLAQAQLLQLNLEQSFETKEQRKLFAYSRYQIPLYRFVLKQISLPEQRLTAQNEYLLPGNPELENPGSMLAMKWYEPVVATALLCSLLIMLWTLK